MVIKSKFQEIINREGFLEWTEFRGWKYGTDILNVCDMPEAINIGVFNLSGVKQLLKLPQEEYLIIPVYVQASDKIRLLRQLNREDNPDCVEICRRFNTDRQDLVPTQIDFWHLDVNNEDRDVESLVWMYLLPTLCQSILYDFFFLFLK